MESFDYKYQNYINALTKLKDALQINEPDEVQIDGIIYRFKTTFDLAMKATKAYLQVNEITDEVVGPRGVINTAFSQGIIYNDDTWVKMMETRNNFNIENSRNIYNEIKDVYVKLLEELCSKLKRGE